MLFSETIFLLIFSLVFYAYGNVEYISLLLSLILAKGEMIREREGDFSYTFVNWDYLDDENYYNKYNAFLYGGWNENIVENYICDNDLKCLLITHSYGQPLTQYMSLYFKETRYLDPQKDRYEGNCLEYIEQYKPDIVIVMYNAEINTGL